MSGEPQPTSPKDHVLQGNESRRRFVLLLEDIVRDLRLSFRTLTRNPGFTIVVILTLALGIGVNTGVFTLVDNAFFRPLPVLNPHQIVSFGSFTKGRPNRDNQFFSHAAFRTIQESNEVFSGLIAHSGFTVHLSADGFTERLWGGLVSSNYTHVLGIEPGIGRGFLPEEGQVPGRNPVAMISDRLWRDRFQGSRDIVGKTVRVNGHPLTLVGVMPAEFKGILGEPDVWVPTMMQPQVLPPNRLDDADYAWLRMIGRLNPDLNLESAQSSLAAVVSQLELEDPGWKDRVLRLAQGHWGTRGDDARSQIRISGIILIAIMGSVLFIACTNVANLLLSRAMGRRNEMAIRLAAGANRSSLVRYLLTETTMLFLAGGAAAVLVAPCFMAMTSLLSLPSHLIRPDLLNFGLALDNRTLLFTLLLSLSTAMIFGLAPAAQSSRIDLFSELKATGAARGGRSVRWRNLLVILQVTLSFTLLVAAGLSIHTLDHRLALDPGFDPENVGTLSVDVATQGYDETRGALFLRQLLRRIETAPGVESATLARFTPADDRYFSTSIHKNDEERIQVEVNSVGPGYFETVRIPLIRGRDFRWTDDQDSRQIAIISQPVAEQFWPDADPIGKRIYSESDSWEVVGVAREVRGRQLGAAQNPHVYFSLLQRYQGTFTLMARSPQQPTSAMVATMRRAVQEMDNDLPTFGATSLSAAIAESVAPWLFLNLLLGAFGVLALTLASVGLYGVLSRSVIRRTHEIAVRLALGARRDHTVWLILRQTLVTVAIGLSIGIGLALSLGQLMGVFLPGFDLGDPVTFVVATLVILAASLLACWVPAFRITRLEPMEALRHE
ncbi:MAG: ABC transporter permease [Acidobacteriota bacterium]|nr:ABC transporter permease [Acidobacteriota bacterium]